MKIKILLFFILFSAFGPAQTKVDSLSVALGNARNDIDKATILNALSDAYKTTHPAKAAGFAAQALELSRRIKFRTEQANAHLNLGNASIMLGEYPNALRHFADAQQIFESEIGSGNSGYAVRKGLAKAYGSMGIVFSEQSNYAKALQFHLKAVQIYEQLRDLEKMAHLYNNIGIVYQAQHKDFKALDYFIKAQKIQEKTGDANIGITLTNIGNSYRSERNFEKAAEYYAKAKTALAKYPNPRALGELYNNFGLQLKEAKQHEQAVQNWKLAIASFESIADKFGIADTYIYLGELYFEKGKLSDALLCANKALGFARQLNIPEQIASSEKLLSEIYQKQHDSQNALIHYKLYSVAKDSLSNHENIRKSVQAEMNFDFEKREALQKKEIEKKELIFAEQSKRHAMQTFFIVLFVLLLVGIGFLVYNRVQLKKTLTLQKELAEYEQKALHLQMNPHFVFNCLGSISSFIVQNGTDSAIKYLSKFSKLMRLTLEYSKESLIPIDKEIESLQNYLELEQLRFNQKFDFKIEKSAEIEDDMAIPPLLLQPFVENAIIHGLIPKKENGQISIAFTIENQSLVCTITDDGIGFNKSQELKENLVSVHKSMALDITRKRLEMMESVTAKSSHVSISELQDAAGNSAGTKVILHLPIQYSKK